MAGGLPHFRIKTPRPERPDIKEAARTFTVVERPGPPAATSGGWPASPGSQWNPSRYGAGEGHMPTWDKNKSQ